MPAQDKPVKPVDPPVPPVEDKPKPPPPVVDDKPKPPVDDKTQFPFNLPRPSGTHKEPKPAETIDNEEMKNLKAAFKKQKEHPTKEVLKAVQEEPGEEHKKFLQAFEEFKSRGQQ